MNAPELLSYISSISDNFWKSIRKNIVIKPFAVRTYDKKRPAPPPKGGIDFYVVANCKFFAESLINPCMIVVQLKDVNREKLLRKHNLSPTSTVSNVRVFYTKNLDYKTFFCQLFLKTSKPPI